MKRTLLLLTLAGLALILMSSVAFAQGCCSSRGNSLGVPTQGPAPNPRAGGCCSTPGASPSTAFQPGIQRPVAAGLPGCCAGTGSKLTFRQAVSPSGRAVPASYSQRPYQAPAGAGAQYARPILLSRSTTSALPSCCQTPKSNAAGRVVQTYVQGPTRSLSALLAGQRRGPIQ